MDSNISTRMIKSHKVAILDYGMGNVSSVYNAFSYIGASPLVTSDQKQILSSDALIIPGVGSFYQAYSNLKSLDLITFLHHVILVKKMKVFGICLGMQMLCLSSQEDQYSPGLGLIPGEISSFSSFTNKPTQIPHIGFNSVTPRSNNSILYSSLSTPIDFYFVHSFCLPSIETAQNCCLGLTTYGEPFIASYEYENIFATQYHPEKSQTNGLSVLKNFLMV